MKCLNCGAINTDGINICFNCGKEIMNINQQLNQQYNNGAQLMQNQNMVSQSFNQINQQPIQGMSFEQTPNKQLENQSIFENNNSKFNNMQSSNKKSNGKIFILIFIIIIAVIIGIILVIKSFDKKNEYSNNESLTDTTSFWLQNNENLYALFDVDGNQLTDFEYTTTSEFVTGISRAINKNGSELISSSGKKILETGKYKYISSYLPVYVMVDEDNKHYLYNSYGKLVRELNKDEEIKSFRSEYKYAMIKSDKEYTIIDYSGDTIIQIPIINGIKTDPQQSSKENYTSIFYNGISYIIDISKRKVLLTIEDSRQFCVYDINDNNSEEFILRTCNEPYGSQQKKGLKLVRNGKIIYSKESDTSITMNYLGNTVMYTEKETYLLDESGNEKTKLDAFISYKDYKNYVKESEKSYFSASKEVEVYVDNVLKEKLNCAIDSGYAEHGVYLLDKCSGYGDGYMIYINSDGTRINDKTYKKAYKFDKNGYATVSEDWENFYLINLKGEKVSDYYSYKKYDQNIYNISDTENLYYGMNKDGTKTIFEVNGKKLLTGKITFPTYKLAVKGTYVVNEKDGKYTIHELSKNKEIATVDSMPNLYDKYFVVTENSKKQYYSYTTGKLFYEN